MAADRIGEVVRHLRRTTARGSAEATDGELLERFVRCRDEGAVAALVRRHGPMVWGVCRRILHSHHDAEDAFQATFLVLVRKASSVVPREMVANWLYGVAHRTALNARTSEARRGALERQEEPVPEPAADGPQPDNDLRHALDRELSRLPDKYRAAIVLCDLEGKTRKDAARQLGVPEGTLSGRLTRGRALLARRLARGGFTLSAGALAAALALERAAACAPAALVSGTIQVITSCAAAVPPAGRVALLTERTLKTMPWSKINSLSLRAVVFGLLAAGLHLFAFPGFAHQSEKERPAQRPAPAGPAAPAAEAARPDARKPQPHYCWLVFGPKAKPRVLVRLDGDELAFDRDGDGKFDGKGERFQSEKDVKDVTIADPVGKASYTITGAHVLHVVPPERFLSLRVHNRGSLDYFQECIVQMAGSPRGAPEAHIDGPLTISPKEWRIANRAGHLLANDLFDPTPLLPGWLKQLAGKAMFTEYKQAKSLKRGSDPTELVAGLVTLGDDSLVAVCSPEENDAGRREKSPFPAGVFPYAEVEFPAARPGDPPLKRRDPLDRPLIDSLYRGAIPVPAEAGAGAAKVTFLLDNWKGFKVAPGTVEIPIEDPPAKKKDPAKFKFRRF
jgi:RNA polymerase sigma factor (sigma-70 family)